MIVKSQSYSFKLFGFNFLIWKVKSNKNQQGHRGIVDGSCKLVRDNNYISVAMPDGTIIPRQIDIAVESNLNEAAVAIVKMHISI